MKKSISVYLLAAIMLFQSLSGLIGGIMLVMDPSGNLLQMPLSFLSNSPFNNYFIPGLILLIVLGLFPLTASFGLLRLPDWKWADTINLFQEKHWAWTWSLYTAIMLIIWITVESAMIGGGHFLQTLYDIVGIVILILSLIPATQKYYQRTIC